MAGPTVEELLQAGGKRRAPPQVGSAETLINRAVGWVPGANRLVDALSAGALELGSSGGTRATLTPEAQVELRAMGEEAPTPEGLLERYRQVRERRRERTELGSEQNPWAARAGDVLGLGLSVLAPLPKFSGTGLPAAVKTGAAHGAIHGATEGAGDLIRGEVGRAAWETLKGGAFGAGAGAIGHGLVRVGQRGVQALRGARSEVLAQETAAAREGAEQAQSAAAKAFEKERREVGVAREMNKAFDKKRGRELLQRAHSGQTSAAGQPDPDTKVLRGFRGKAGERWGAEDPRLQRYVQELQDPNLPAARRERIQQYVDEHRLAFDDPAAFERAFMERYIRERYPTEQAERILQRIGPKGEILPRAVQAAPGGLPQRQPALTAPPAVRPGVQAMPYGQNLRRAASEEPSTVLATPSRAAPEEIPLQPPASPSGTPAAPLGPREVSSTPVEEVTRLAGPGDVGALASERAAAREAGALGAIGRAGMEGVRSSGNVLGAVLGGAAGLSRELLRDPAVRARALSAAKLHLLERINPQLFARVGSTLAAAAARGESEYRAARLLELRRNPELRLAEQQAAREAERLSDEDLLRLFAGSPTQP